MIALPDPLPAHAWQIDRHIRLNAVPLDRRTHPSQWYDSQTVFPTGDALIALFWNATVPGSGAPEIPYVEMVQSRHNQGYDVHAAEQLLPTGLQLAAEGRAVELRALTARLLHALHSAPRLPDHPYWQHRHPLTWADIVAEMDQPDPVPQPGALRDLEDKILHGWLGQLAGGSFGTAIEGYHSQRIAAVYGVIDAYLTPPETVNDDVVYELVLLDVFERSRRSLSAVEIGLEWLRQIPFGWSAEWIALKNLGMGILPPDSGAFRNPYNDWIGAQMRGMACGFLAAGHPLEAARLAYLDSSVSHAANGVYGGMYAAVLTALAFVRNDPRQLLREGLRYLPQRSEYVQVARHTLALLENEPDPQNAWRALDARFEEYNWIHAYPNLAADMLALWHCGGEMTSAFRWLAHAGLDVDCNAGLVGSVLGVMRGAPPQWSHPLEDTLETYLPGRERLSIRVLAGRTARLARQ